MNNRLTTLIVACFWISLIARSTHAEPPVHLTLHADHTLNTINPLFFGVNTLFMYDDKTVLSNDTFIRLLHDAPIRLIRFPGGDVADNYYWDEHRPDDPSWWPRDDNRNSADTDSFMTFCRKVGAEPLFVVNLESGFVHHDLDSAIKRAADWVAYCRQHNYHVKYWEIGNETFWYHPGKHKRIRVTAAEYGQAFSRFASAMKAADPTIQIGAIGLVDPTISANNTLADGSTASSRQPAWWPTVIADAGPHIDFVTVHSYPGGEKQTYDYFIHKGVWGGETIPTLRSFLDKTLARHVPIILTEWNLSGKTPLQGIALAQAQTTLLCRFLSAGVDMACLWPLRLPHAGSHPLLDYHTFNPLPFYHVVAMLSPALAGERIIPCDSDDPTLVHFAARSADTLTTILIHKSTSNDPYPVVIKLPHFIATQATGEALVAPSLQSADAHRIPLTCQQNPDGTWTCDLPPYSICVLKLTRAK